ncbi:hypothetical protein V8E54_014117 [Elaphomyces granulatus]
MAATPPKSYSTDPTLYLYTSLTAGSSHIITATSRLETILKANKIAFRAIDVATDEKARMLWGRRSKGRKLPGLVKFGSIIGDLEQIEEWNEYGELKQQVNAASAIDPLSNAPSPPASKLPPLDNPAPRRTSNAPHIQIQCPPSRSEKKEDHISLTLRQAGAAAASRAKENARAKLGARGASGNQLSISKPETKCPEVATPDKEAAGRTPTEPAGEKPVASIPGSIVEAKRPSLLTEEAAESTASFQAENAEALGLVEHHRGSIIAATSPEEKEEITHDLRSSIAAHACPEKPVETKE